jgi:hypothetical protein
MYFASAGDQKPIPEASNVSVRLHGKGNIDAKPTAEAVADILTAIKGRRG